MKKRKMLRNIRSCAILYVVLILGSTAGVRVLVPWYYSWLSTTIAHTVVWLVTAFLCYLSRPVEGTFFTSTEQLGPFMSVQQFAENHNVEEVDEATRPWDLSKTLLVEWPSELLHNKAELSVAYEVNYFEQQKDVK
jgi:hypothetical protein